MSSFEVRLKAFLAHYEELSQNMDKEDGFLREFIALKLQSQSYKEHNTYPVDSGQLACNRKKNRFKDILPFEYTRVSLHPVEGVEGSDYINANYITGTGTDVPYIAAQGPLLHTVKDFWRMLWYHNIEVVVMACREVEMAKPKCQIYWPALHEEIEFGSIRVTTTYEENISNDFVIRDLMAECDGQQQKIRQYHYMSWPDHGKPDSAEPIIRMTEMIDRQRKRKEVPLVVHCSAGCGRTGTILAIDICRTMLVSKSIPEEFSVYKVVEQMRQQRPAMVQAREQYSFVYMAAAELAKRALGMKPHVPAKPDNSSKKNSKRYQNVEVDSPDGKQPTETESEAIYQNTEAIAPPTHARSKTPTEDPANGPPPIAPPRTGAKYENVQLTPEIKVGGENGPPVPPAKSRPPIARKRSQMKNQGEKPENGPAPATAPKPRPRSKPESPVLSRTPSPPDHTHRPLPEVPPTEEDRQPSPRPSLPYAPTTEPVSSEAIYSSVDMASLRDMGPAIQLVDESSGRRAELNKVEKKLEKKLEQFTHEDMSPTKKSSILETILAEVGDLLPDESKPSPPLPPVPNPQKFVPDVERLPFTSQFPDEVPPEIPRRTVASQELMDDEAPAKPVVTITKSLSGGDINSLYESPTPLSIPMTNTVDDDTELLSASAPVAQMPSGGVGSGVGSHGIATVPRNFNPSQSHSPSKSGGLFGKLRGKKSEKKKMTIGDISGPITSSMVKSNSDHGGMAALQPGTVVGGAGGGAGDLSNLDHGARLQSSTSPQHERADERYKFPGDMGYGIRIGKPRGPRPEPPSWKPVPNNVV